MLIAICLSDSEEDFNLYIQCLMNLKEYRITFHLLEERNLIDINIQNIHYITLASQCLFHLQDYQKCKSLLDQAHSFLKQFKSFADDFISFDYSRILCLRARIYEIEDNILQAKSMYILALQYDSMNWEAEQKLSDTYISSNDMISLITKNWNQKINPFFKYSLEDWSWINELFTIYLNKEKSFQLSSTPIMNQLSLKSADIILWKAIYSFYQYDYLQTIILAKQCIQSNTISIYPYIYLSSSLLLTNNKVDLFSLATSLLEISPDTKITLYVLSCYYVLIKDYIKARMYIQKCITKEYSFLPSWILLAYTCNLQKERGHVITALSSAVTHSPTNYIPLLSLSREYILNHNYILAAQCLTQCLSLNTTDPLVYNELGIIYYYNKDYKRAIELFLKAIDIISTLPFRLKTKWICLFENLSSIYREIGEYKQAVYILDQATIIGGSSINTCIFNTEKGYIYHLQDDLLNAIAYYNKGLNLDPTNQLTQKLLIKAVDRLSMK
ncbi:hypothetical protein WA158_002110 [Blastocystis sp. Blastoise]